MDDDSCPRSVLDCEEVPSCDFSKFSSPKRTDEGFERSSGYSSCFGVLGTVGPGSADSLDGTAESVEDRMLVRRALLSSS